MGGVKKRMIFSCTIRLVKTYVNEWATYSGRKNFTILGIGNLTIHFVSNRFLVIRRFYAHDWSRISQKVPVVGRKKSGFLVNWRFSDQSAPVQEGVERGRRGMVRISPSLKLVGYC